MGDGMSLDPSRIFSEWADSLKGEWDRKTKEEESSLRARILEVSEKIEAMRDPAALEEEVQVFSARVSEWQERLDSLTGTLGELEVRVGAYLKEVATAEHDETNNALQRCALLLKSIKDQQQFEDDCRLVASMADFFGKDFSQMSYAQFKAQISLTLKERIENVQMGIEKEIESACAKAREETDLLDQNEELRQKKQDLEKEVKDIEEYLQREHSVTSEVLRSLAMLKPSQIEDFLNTVIRPKIEDAKLENEWHVPADVFATERQKWM